MARGSNHSILLIFLSLFAVQFAQANLLTYHGRILRSDDSPLNSPTARFKIEIRDPVSQCILWQEEQSLNMSTLNGIFSLNISDATASGYTRTDGHAWNMQRVFSNRTGFTGLSGCTAGTTYTPGPTDGRLILVSFKEAPADPTWQDIPVTKLNYVPMSLNSAQLAGFQATEFLKMDPAASQTPLTVGEVNTLLQLISGTYGLTGDLTGTLAAPVVDGIRGVGVSATAPALNQVLKFNGTIWAPAADDTGAAPGDASYAAKGVVQFDTNLATSGINVVAGVASLPNTITAAGPIGNAQTVPIITYDAKGRLTTVASATIDDNTKLPLAGGTMTGPINMGNQNITNVNSVAATNFSGRNLVLNDNDTNTVTIRTPNDIIANYVLQLPANDGAPGEVLSTDGSGVLSWIAPGGGGTGDVLNNGNSFGAAMTLGTNDNFALNFETNGTNKMTILPNGNVGIGTINPTVELEVIGDIKAPTGASLSFGNTTNGGIRGGDNFVALQVDVTDRLVVDYLGDIRLTNQANNQDLVFTDSGNLGVGLITPNTRLDVNGAISQRGMAAPAVSPAGQGRIYFDSTSNKFRVSENGGAYTDLVGGGGGSGDVLNNGNSFGAAMTLGTNDNFALNFETNSTNRMTILNNGNVGIGTATPTTTLDVAGEASIRSTNNANLYLYGASAQPAGLTASNTTGNLRVYSPRSVSIGMDSLDSSTGNLIEFIDNVATASENVLMVIEDSGNVGIGTTSPTSKLTVSGVSEGGDGVSIESATGLIRLRPDGTNGNVIRFGGTGGAANKLRFLGPSDAEYMYIDVSTARINSTLNVQSGELQLVGANALRRPGSDLEVNSTSILNGGINFYTSSALSATERMRITSTGNVGIGTTTPGSKLHVQTDAAGIGMSLRSGGAANRTWLSVGRTTDELQVGVAGAANDFYNGVSAGDGILRMNTASKIHLGMNGLAPAITIEPDLVGFGTMYPQTNFDLQGSMQFRGISSEAIAPTADHGRIYYDVDDKKFKISENGGAYVDLVGAGGGSGFVNGGNSFGAAATLGTNDNFGLNFETNGSNRLIIDNTGNIAVGALSPLYKLDVDGDVNVPLTNAYLMDGGPVMQMYTGPAFGVSNLFVGTKTYVSGLNTTNSAANTAVGIEAGDSITDGSHNTAFGFSTAGSLTTGSDNVFMGSFAGWQATTGSQNTVVGRYSADSMTTGSQNTLFGHRVLMGNTTGSENTAVGNEAGGTEGSPQGDMARNTLLGHRAGFAFDGGAGAGLGPDNNILLGYRAGDTITTGDQNLLIGYDIDAPTATTNNFMSIGNLIYATNVDGTGTTVSTGNVGIGVATPGTRLDINGATTQRGMAAPAVSAAGQGRIYFDSTSNKFRVSENGGAYVDLVGAGGSGFVNGGNSFGAAATLGTNDNFALNFETNGATAMTVLANGNVGIGTVTPTARLDLNRSSTSTASTLNLSSTMTPTVVGQTLTGVSNEVSSDGNQNTTRTVGSYSYVNTMSSGTSSTVIGNDIEASYDGVGGSASRVSGQFISVTDFSSGSTIANFYGQEIYSRVSSAPVTNQYGVLARTLNDSFTTAGNVTTLQVENNNQGGIVTNLIGVRTQVNNISGTTTNRYGLYIDTQSGSATSANDFALYSVATQKSHFAGSLGIGSGVTTPSSVLDINGAQTIRGMAAPAVSPAGQGRIFFNSATNKFRVSENGGAYVDLVSGGGSDFANGGNSFGAAATLGTNDNFALNFETNGATAMTVLPNSNVGIGTVTPGSRFDLQETNSATSGAKNLSNHLLTVNPPSASTAVNQGLKLRTINSGVGAYNYGTLRGAEIDAEFNGALTSSVTRVEGLNISSYAGGGTATDVIGASILAMGSGPPSTTVTNLTGIDLLTELDGPGSSTNMYGIRSTLSTSGTVTSTNRYGIYHNDYNSGTSTNTYGVYIYDDNWGTVTNHYGLFLDTRATATNNFGVYQNAAGARNFFAGNVGIGSGVTTPSSVLDINGAQTIRGMAAPAVSPAGQGRIYFDSTSNKFRVSENGGAYVDLVGAAGSGFANGGNSFGAVATLGTNDNFALNFETNGANRMRIAAGGNVGVGNTNPLTLLHVGPGSSAPYDGSGNVPFMVTQSGNTAISVKDSSSGIEFGAGTFGSYIYSGSMTNDDYHLISNDLIRMTVLSSGEVGIGTTSPQAALEVAGTIRGLASVNNATATIDFGNGNLHHTTNDCGTFNLHNMLDGATYMFIVKGTNVATCAFNAYSDAGSTALTVRLPPGHGATTVGKHTVYNFVVSGTDVYVSWTPGY